LEEYRFALTTQTIYLSIIYVSVYVYLSNIYLSTFGPEDLQGRWVSIPSPMESTIIPASWEGVVNVHFCILKRRYRVSYICHRADSKILSRLFLPTPLRSKQTSSSKTPWKSMNEKSPCYPYPNSKLKHP
jgi:hypothetical protein